jgi:hypothetical protein
MPDAMAKQRIKLSVSVRATIVDCQLWLTVTVYGRNSSAALFLDLTIGLVRCVVSAGQEAFGSCALVGILAC